MWLYCVCVWIEKRKTERWTLIIITFNSNWMVVVCGLIFLLLHSAAFRSLFLRRWNFDSKWNLLKVIGSNWVHGLCSYCFKSLFSPTDFLVLFSFLGFIHTDPIPAQFFLCALFVCHIRFRPLALANPIWVNVIVYRSKYGCNLHYGYDSRAF